MISLVTSNPTLLILPLYLAWKEDGKWCVLYIYYLMCRQVYVDRELAVDLDRLQNDSALRCKQCLVHVPLDTEKLGNCYFTRSILGITVPIPMSMPHVPIHVRDRYPCPCRVSYIRARCPCPGLVSISMSMFMAMSCPFPCQCPPRPCPCWCPFPCPCPQHEHKQNTTNANTNMKWTGKLNLNRNIDLNTALNVLIIFSDAVGQNWSVWVVSTMQLYPMYL